MTWFSKQEEISVGSISLDVSLKDERCACVSISKHCLAVDGVEEEERRRKKKKHIPWIRH